jgi:hypothetical protein
MADGSAGAADAGSSAAPVGPSQASGGPSAARKQLAGQAETLADTLAKAYRKLTRTAPKTGKQMDFWEQGLEEIQIYLEDVQSLLDECEKLVKAENKANVHNPKIAKSEKLAKALGQLDDAIGLAHERIGAARASLEMDDREYSARSRSRDFVSAASQLKELAGFCEAAATQLKGTAALAREAKSARTRPNS